MGLAEGQANWWQVELGQSLQIFPSSHSVGFRPPNSTLCRKDSLGWGVSVTRCFWLDKSFSSSQSEQGSAVSANVSGAGRAPGSWCSASAAMRRGCVCYAKDLGCVSWAIHGFHSSEVCKAQNQGARRFGVWRGPASLAHSQKAVFSLSPRMAGRGQGSNGSGILWSLIPPVAFLYCSWPPTLKPLLLHQCPPGKSSGTPNLMCWLSEKLHAELLILQGHPTFFIPVSRKLHTTLFMGVIKPSSPSLFSG